MNKSNKIIIATLTIAGVAAGISIPLANAKEINSKIINPSNISVRRTIGEVQIELDGKKGAHGDTYIIYNEEQNKLLGNFIFEMPGENRNVEHFDVLIKEKDGVWQDVFTITDVDHEEIEDDDRNRDDDDEYVRATASFEYDFSNYLDQNGRKTFCIEINGKENNPSRKFSSEEVDFTIDFGQTSPVIKDIIPNRGVHSISGEFEIESDYANILQNGTILATPVDGGQTIEGFVNVSNRTIYIPSLLEDTAYDVMLTVDGDTYTEVISTIPEDPLVNISDVAVVSKTQNSASIVFDVEPSFTDVDIKVNLNGITHSVIPASLINEGLNFYDISELSPETSYNFTLEQQVEHNVYETETTHFETKRVQVLNEDFELNHVHTINPEGEITTWYNFVQGEGEGAAQTAEIRVVQNGVLAALETVDLNDGSTIIKTFKSPELIDGLYDIEFVIDGVVEHKQTGIQFDSLDQPIISNISYNVKNGKTGLGFTFNPGDETGTVIEVKFNGTPLTLTVVPGFNSFELPEVETLGTDAIIYINGLPVNTTSLTAPEAPEADISDIEILSLEQEQAKFRFDVDDANQLTEDIYFKVENSDGNIIQQGRAALIAADYGEIFIEDLIGSSDYVITLDEDGVYDLESEVQTFRTSEYIESDGAIIDIDVIDEENGVFNVVLTGSINDAFTAIEYKLPGGEWTELLPEFGTWKEGDNIVQIDLPEGVQYTELEWNLVPNTEVEYVETEVEVIKETTPSWVIPVVSILGALLGVMTMLFGFLWFRKNGKDPIRVYEYTQLTKMKEDELDKNLEKWGMSHEDHITRAQKIEALEHVYVYKRIVK